MHEPATEDVHLKFICKRGPDVQAHVCVTQQLSNLAIKVAGCRRLRFEYPRAGLLYNDATGRGRVLIALNPALRIEVVEQTAHFLRDEFIAKYPKRRFASM